MESRGARAMLINSALAGETAARREGPPLPLKEFLELFCIEPPRMRCVIDFDPPSERQF
jgi:hypothetical protein